MISPGVVAAITEPLAALSRSDGASLRVFTFSCTRLGMIQSQATTRHSRHMVCACARGKVWSWIMSYSMARTFEDSYDGSRCT
jgi:hypothetical protein